MCTPYVASLLLSCHTKGGENINLTWLNHVQVEVNYYDFLNTKRCVCVCVCTCISPLTAEWQPSLRHPTAALSLSHPATIMKLNRTRAPPQQFESNLWFLLTALKAEPHPNSCLKRLRKQGVFLSRVQPRTGVWNLLCVIFIDRCWEAGVCQSLEIRWERSHSLCASQ